MKKLGMEIGKKMKDECSHIQWIDLTQNDFDQDSATVMMIINGLKKQKELLYVLDALQVNMSLAEVNFHGNFLDNEFAVDLSYVLERN
jgi:hypothetical protein